MTGIGFLADSLITVDASALMGEEGAVYGETAEASADAEESGAEYAYNDPGRQMARARKLQTLKGAMFRNRLAHYALQATIPLLTPN